MLNRSLRLVAIIAVAAAAVMGTAVTGVSASTMAPATTAAYAVPKGCNNYNFCEYNAGNGGNLCFQTRKSENWPSECADHNEGEYNRGTHAVLMYSQANYKGCYYLLYSGHYLLYNAKDYFQGPSDFCRHETLEHKLVSSKFV